MIGQRFVPYLGAVAAVLVVFFLAAISVKHEAPVGTQTATSSAATPTPPIAAIPFQDLLPNPGNQTKQISPKVTPTESLQPEITPAENALTPINASVPPPPQNLVDLETSAAHLHDALVNIICGPESNSSIRPVSGSGVVVDSKGIILTNAHVAEYLLLQDKGVVCIVRTGTPAKTAYTASLMFISPAWIHANAAVLTEATPMGTGENDFAFLAIDSSLTDAPLPSSFPFVPLGNEALPIGEDVVIGSYGAEFLDSAQIKSALSPTIVFGSIKKLFTFATSTIDLVSLGGSEAAQEGSSGGGIVDGKSTLIATITTSSTKGDTAMRNLNAITATYIRRDYEIETGQTIEALFSEPTSAAVSNFKSSISALEKLILQNL